MFNGQLKGIVLSLVIGLAAWFASPFTGALNSILLALLLGIAVTNSVKLPLVYADGIKFTSGKLLEISILFLAIGINYSDIAAIGGKTFLIITFSVFFTLLLTIYLAKVFRCPGSSGWLIGFGTAICGSSAIAALAPSIANKSKKEDVAISMAVINLYGSIGMIVLPLILSAINASYLTTGTILGGSLHSVGNVAGAAYGINNSVGEGAIAIKLGRVALLSPGLIFFSLLINKGEKMLWYKRLSLPWYLWGFIAISIFVSFIPIPKGILTSFDTLGKIILTVAMAAIGLRVGLKNLFVSGRSGLVFGFVIFLIHVLFLFLGIKFL